MTSSTESYNYLEAVRAVLGTADCGPDHLRILCQLSVPPSCKNDSDLGVVAVIRPYDLPLQDQDALFNRGLPYILKAFNDSIDDAACVQAHHDHFIGADFVFLLVQKTASTTEREEEADEALLPSTAQPLDGDQFVILGHSSWCYNPSLHKVGHKDEIGALRGKGAVAEDVGKSNEATLRAWFLEGICTDPVLQGKGLGQLLLSTILHPTNIQTLIAAGAPHGVQIPRVNIVLTRTQNKAILWMLHRLLIQQRGESCRQPCVYPAALRSGAAEVGKSDEVQTFVAGVVSGYFPQHEVSTFNATTGVMVGVYQPQWIESFGNASPCSSSPASPPSPPSQGVIADPFESKEKLGMVVDSLLETKRGDAMVPAFML